MKTKTLFLTTLVFVFLQVCSPGIQAQTAESDLDQLKLNQNFSVGTWQRIVGKDTVEVVETQQYGNAFVTNVYFVINGKKSFSYASNYGFSSKEGKFNGFILLPNGIYQTWIGLYTTKKMFCADIVQNFNPEKVIRKIEIVYDTPTNMTHTRINSEGVKTREVKFSKVK
jgi:hypothetical protein